MKGFHLIEILICLSIIVIISKFGMGLWVQYTVITNRTLAKVILYELATKLEQYHFQHHSYKNATFKTLLMNEYTNNHAYKLVIEVTNKNLYVIKAAPEGTQAIHDTLCGTLILTSLNVKDRTGGGSIKYCWH